MTCKFSSVVTRCPIFTYVKPEEEINTTVVLHVAIDIMLSMKWNIKCHYSTVTQLSNTALSAINNHLSAYKQFKNFFWINKPKTQYLTNTNNFSLIRRTYYAIPYYLYSSTNSTFLILLCFCVLRAYCLQTSYYFRLIKVNMDN